MVKIQVRPHYRNGRYINSYLRSRPPSNGGTAKAAGLPGALTGVALEPFDESGRRTQLVDRKGKVFSVDGITIIKDADFSGYNIDNINTTSLTFENCNLKGATFSNCRIQGFNATESDLSEAKFVKSAIDFRSVEKSNLSRASFTECQVDGGYGSACEKSDLSEVMFERSLVQGLELKESRFDGAIIRDCQVSGLSMMDTSATGLIVDRSKMSLDVFDSDLSGALIKESQIKGHGPWEDVRLRNAHIVDSTIEGVTLRVGVEDRVADSYYESIVTSAIKDFFLASRNRKNKRRHLGNLKGLTIENSALNSVEFQDSDLSKSTIRNSEFLSCTFLSTKMSGLNVEGSEFRSSRFIKVNARKLRASGSNFERAVMGSNDDRSDFSGSDFSEANFKLSVLGNSKVKGCKWTKANTSGMEIFDHIKGTPLSVAEGHSGDVASLKETSYEHYSLPQAAKKMGATDKAFEFLVVSGAVEVRHNLTKQKVSEDFDISMNHIPAWQMQNLPKVDAAG